MPVRRWLRRLAFGFDQLTQGTAKVRERRVRDDRVHPEVRISVEHLLLSLDDELVLEEALHHALVERLRDGRVLQVVVVQVIPEEVGRALGLGREELAIAVLLRALQVAALRA